MTDKELQKVIEALKTTVENTVNGKIKRLDEKLDAYIKTDIQWKETVQPVIDAYSTVNKVGLFVEWVWKVGTPLIAIAGGIIYLIKKSII